MPEIGWRLIMERAVPKKQWFMNSVFIDSLGIAIVVTLVALLLSNVTINRYQHHSKSARCITN